MTGKHLSNKLQYYCNTLCNTIYPVIHKLTTPYANHIAYTSKSVNVSLFDLSQQLLQILKYRYWKGCEVRDNYSQNLRLKKPHRTTSALSLFLIEKTSYRIKKERGEEHILEPIKIMLGDYLNHEHTREFCGSRFDLISIF